MSLGSRWLGFACLFASIVLSALGQLGMKAGMREWQQVAASHDVALSDASLATLSPGLLWLTAGLAAYGLSMLAWLVVLVRYRLSYAYPLLGVSYVLVYVGATQWPRLMEPVTTARTVGTVLILAGVALVALTRDERSVATDSTSRGEG